MRRHITCVSMITVLVASSMVSAQTMVIPHTDRGWYNEAGVGLGGSNMSYFVGDLGGSCGHCGSDHRNFFVFDLSGVTQPILSAKLELFVPSPLGYLSADLTENYELHDVITPIATLLDGTGGVAAHTDLGVASSMVVAR